MVRRSCISIVILDDPYYEYEEQFSLRFVAIERLDPNNPDNLVLDPSRPNIIIVDDDGTVLVFIYL